MAWWIAYAVGYGVTLAALCTLPGPPVDAEDALVTASACVFWPALWVAALVVYGFWLAWKWG